MEFYKHFKDALTPILREVYEASFHNGLPPKGTPHSFITLIPKDSPGRKNVKNYRPLSLLNTDYKILSKTLTTKLKTVMEFLIYENQQCATPGRETHNHLHNIREIISYCKDKVNILPYSPHTMQVSPNGITRGGTHYKPRPDFLCLRNRNVPRQRTRATTGADSVFPSNRQRTEPLKILQLNVQGGMTLRHAQMCTLLQEKGIHVILAQEVLLGSGKSYSLPGYQMYHCSCMDRKKRCRGIATFIPRGLKASVENIKTPTGTDAQKIALWWDGKRFDLINQTSTRAFCGPWGSSLALAAGRDILAGVPGVHWCRRCTGVSPCALPVCPFPDLSRLSEE